MSKKLQGCPAFGSCPDWKAGDEKALADHIDHCPHIIVDCIRCKPRKQLKRSELEEHNRNEHALEWQSELAELQLQTQKIAVLAAQLELVHTSALRVDMLVR